MSKFYALRKHFLSLQTQKKLTIFYVDDESYCDHIIREYFMGHKVLGLDCEWVTRGRHRQPVSLLQMANPDGVCALFRMPKLYCEDCSHESHLVSSLGDLLRRDDVIKVGVAIENDSKHLDKDYNVRISSWLDLRHIARDNGVLPRGLAYLAHETVGLKLDKRFSVRVSNWEAEELSEEQIQYAAMDAHAAISIFTYFVALKQSLLRLLFPLTSDAHEQYIQNHNITSYLEVDYRDKKRPN